MSCGKADSLASYGILPHIMKMRTETPENFGGTQVVCLLNVRLLFIFLDNGR